MRRPGGPPSCGTQGNRGKEAGTKKRPRRTGVQARASHAVTVYLSGGSHQATTFNRRSPQGGKAYVGRLSAGPATADVMIPGRRRLSRRFRRIRSAAPGLTIDSRGDSTRRGARFPLPSQQLCQARAQLTDRSYPGR